MTITDELRARLFLLRAAEPPAPAPAVYDYVAVHGPVEATARIRGRTAPPAVLAEITRPQSGIEHDLRAIDDGQARLLTPEDDDWPLGRLGTIGSLGAPLALWVRGDASLTELTGTAVALTGMRWASGYGNTVAAKWSTARSRLAAAHERMDPQLAPAQDRAGRNRPSRLARRLEAQVMMPKRAARAAGFVSA